MTRRPEFAELVLSLGLDPDDPGVRAELRPAFDAWMGAVSDFELRALRLLEVQTPSPGAVRFDEPEFLEGGAP